MAFIEGLFCTRTVHLGPGCLAVIQRWALFRAGVAVKRRSTVHILTANNTQANYCLCHYNYVGYDQARGNNTQGQWTNEGIDSILVTNTMYDWSYVCIEYVKLLT